MKVTAIIAEYNPFHNGHLKQLKAAKRETKPDALVVLMSGSFTQRGDMTIVDKYTRANWAIEAGADLVLELPTIYSLSNAKGFAEGAIKTLSMFPEFTLSFGTEQDDLEDLKMTTEFLSSESRETSQMIKSLLSEGYSPIKAKTMAISKTHPDIAHMISTPNNILAVEYMRASLHCKSHIEFHNVLRKPDDMKKFASSTKIREMLEKGQDVSAFIPDFVDLSKVINKTKVDAIEMYSLKSKTPEQLHDLANISEGIENRISKLPVSDINELLDNLINKRYSRATIKRIVASATINLERNLVDLAKEQKPYCVVLAARKSKQNKLFKELSKADGYFFFKHSDCEKDNPVYPLVKLDVTASKIHDICY